jgi:hypothetical protein
MLAQIEYGTFITKGTQGRRRKVDASNERIITPSRT